MHEHVASVAERKHVLFILRAREQYTFYWPRKGLYVEK